MIDLTMPQFSIPDQAVAKSACGPVALAGAMRCLGGEACERDIIAIAREEGWWTAEAGMLGPAAFEAMARSWGVILESIAPATVAQWTRISFPCVISTAFHYYLVMPDVTGFPDWQTANRLPEIYVGNTGLARLAIAAEWTTIDRIVEVDGEINGCWRCVRLERGGVEVTSALDGLWAETWRISRKSPPRTLAAQRRIVTLKRALGRQA